MSIYNSTTHNIILSVNGANVGLIQTLDLAGSPGEIQGPIIGKIYRVLFDLISLKNIVKSASTMWSTLKELPFDIIVNKKINNRHFTIEGVLIKNLTYTFTVENYIIADQLEIVGKSILLS